MARFESCAHRYVDLSRDDYGVALLNNCKYGHKAHMNILDLALLRSPSNPDPDADKGAHEFTYSLFPHKGNLTNSNVMIEAASLNNSPLIFDGMRNTKTHLPCGVEGKGLSLEVLKRAEKEDCLVLRVVETLGRNSSGKIIVRKPGSRLVETDLMEWTSGRETVCKGSTDIHLAPFEIRTYKLIQK